MTSKSNIVSESHVVPESLKCLLQIGRHQDDGTSSFNYKDYQLDQSHVNDLIALIINSETVAELPYPANWAVQYALEAIAQMPTVWTITPIIHNLSDLTRELGIMDVIVKMLKHSDTFVSTTPLCDELLNGVHHSEWTRMVVAEILSCFFGRSDIDGVTLQRIYNTFVTYLRNPCPQDRIANAFVILALAKNNRVECAGDIRQAFNSHIVDIAYAGDLEEIEIVLGVRESRSTPKPHWFHAEKHDLSLYKRLNNIVKESSKDTGSLDDILKMSDSLDKTILIVEYFLQTLGVLETTEGAKNTRHLSDISALDGFFAAVLSSKTLIIPSVWLVELWGGEAFSPEWETMELVQIFHHAVMAYYNYVASTLNKDDWAPMVLTMDDEGEALDVLFGWCGGYKAGMRLWQGALTPTEQSNSSNIKRLLNVFLLKDLDSFERFRLLSYADKEVMVDELFQAVCDFYSIIQRVNTVRRAPTFAPIVRDAPKTGRNDPCFCGSGKKFKQCCLHCNVI